MPWYVPVVVRMVTGFVAVPILLKPLVDRYAQAPLLLVQFAGCFALALVLAAALGQASPDWTIVAVGGVNGLAAYCYRQAIAMSLSRTALFAFWDDLLAMGLSYGLLGEGQFLNLYIILGIVVSISAVILFTVHSSREGPADKDEENRIPMRLYWYAGAYSIILGVGVFFMRYLGLQGIGLGTFLVNWYGGVVLAAAVLLLSTPAEERAEQAMLPRGDWLRVVGLSGLVLGTMSAAFWAYRLAPQTVVQPLFLVGEMVGPALVGLYVFGERQVLERQEHLYFAVGLVGGVLVALSFSGVL
jgi:hypothetical protein